MRVIATAYSNMGSRKQVNQDGYFMKSGRIGNRLICLAAICDGMGGFEAGEKASHMVINQLNQWFMTRLPVLVQTNSTVQHLDNELITLFDQMNDELIQYGGQHKIQLGTTCSMMLMIDQDVFIYHIGDSRIYHQSKGTIQKVTDDQTVAARKVRHQEMTEEQARKSPERSVLLQCIGVRNPVKPEKIVRHVQENDSFLLCSDGFYFSLAEDEIQTLLSLKSINQVDIELEKLVNNLRKRGEVDDATAVVLQLIPQ